MVWKPHVTVAAVAEDKSRFLIVEEKTNKGIKLNQPAGHLENGEDLIQAIKREVFEETAWLFEPEFIVSVQLWRKNPDAPSFLRFTFSGHCHSFVPDQTLDNGIIATHWLKRSDLYARSKDFRSPMVIKSIDQYLSGSLHSLEMLHSFFDLDT